MNQVIELASLKIGYLFHSGAPRDDIDALKVLDNDILKVSAAQDYILQGKFRMQAQKDVDIGQPEIRVKQTGMMALCCQL